MHTVTVPLGDRSYPILIGPGLLGSAPAHLRAAGLAGPILVVADEAVAGRYGELLLAGLRDAGYPVALHRVPSGESSKCLGELERIYAACAEAGIDRGGVLVSLGGGVVGDLGGFAAATWLRGIAFVQAPTTLLAQVDAAVGGKTGIDLPFGKNLVGAFHQPRLVIADTSTLATLPEREFRAGLAEVVKYGVIADPALFAALEANPEGLSPHELEWIGQVVSRCCEIKAEIVGADEQEGGRRAILNYGHTVGHAVETAAGYGTYLHGEAVSIGMTAAGVLSHRLAGLAKDDVARVEALSRAVGLPTRLAAPLPEEVILEAARMDKKNRGGRFRCVLAETIGRVRVQEVPESDLRAGIRAIQPGSGEDG